METWFVHATTAPRRCRTALGMPDNNLVKLVRRTLIASLRSSVGTKIFQHMYVRRKNDGKELDTANGGKLSQNERGGLD